MFINFAKQQKDSTTIGDLSFLVPDGQRSMFAKIRHGLKKARDKVKRDKKLQFSKLLNTRQNNGNEEDSYMEDEEETLTIDFQRSSVSKIRFLFPLFFIYTI